MLNHSINMIFNFKPQHKYDKDVYSKSRQFTCSLLLCFIEEEIIFIAIKGHAR